ncbi:hypothetical protein B0T21DRAFT_425871 [Apiosordaria backusii]|uniref:Prolyl 4-hydroxylase alpha subunit Fe(2+) 2OG dioxygenase domain-containing protein n=1 Tax=Apiosordaria backusii TaxID=314023 RepID=A0AA40AIN9_9PEZI|nr:hypothetical protein B0T21DRAFT_425871 [Apiosordaria backusii]
MASISVEQAIEMQRHAHKKDILSAYRKIESKGTFASSKALRQPPPAGLFIDGLGDVTMPLSETQARDVKARCRQAPYGKSSDTIVDTTVRNTWELDASQFSFRDPKWGHYIQALVQEVAKSMGVVGTIKAEIYKMLVYEEGAMFKPHTDTEKIPGMFGTLVIALPSPHQGGDVVVKHCGQTMTFKTSEHPQSFVCWYSDVSHEVLPVTSGYR